MLQDAANGRGEGLRMLHRQHHLQVHAGTVPLFGNRGLEGLQGIFIIGGGKDHRRRVFATCQLVGGGDAIEHRHADVQQYHIRLLLLAKVQGLLTIACLGHDLTGGQVFDQTVQAFAGQRLERDGEHDDAAERLRNHDHFGFRWNAGDHGVDYWIFDWYWYNDGPFLERCLEEGYFGAANNDRVKFCCMWANHDWIDIHPAKFRDPRALLYPGAVTRETFETITGYVSNTLSFLRVAAFSLNHVALAIAVFTLVDMMNSAGGRLLMVVFGNIFILILEGAIVTIQALRLEYYEGFSRFYSGDGKEFKPLRLETGGHR